MLPLLIISIATTYAVESDRVVPEVATSLVQHPDPHRDHWKYAYGHRDSIKPLLRGWGDTSPHGPQTWKGVHNCEEWRLRINHGFEQCPVKQLLYKAMHAPEAFHQKTYPLEDHEGNVVRDHYTGEVVWKYNDNPFYDALHKNPVNRMREPRNNPQCSELWGWTNEYYKGGCGWYKLTTIPKGKPVKWKPKSATWKPAAKPAVMPAAKPAEKAKPAAKDPAICHGSLGPGGRTGVFYTRYNEHGTEANKYRTEEDREAQTWRAVKPCEYFLIQIKLTDRWDVCPLQHLLARAMTEAENPFVLMPKYQRIHCYKLWRALGRYYACHCGSYRLTLPPSKPPSKPGTKPFMMDSAVNDPFIMFAASITQT